MGGVITYFERFGKMLYCTVYILSAFCNSNAKLGIYYDNLNKQNY